MPNRFAGLDMILAAAAAWVVSLFGAVEASTTAGIATSWILASWSMVGALGGGFVSVLISRDWGQAGQARARAARWIASSITGFVATPAAMRYFGLAVEPDLIMGVAAGIAFIAWGGLKVGQAAFNRWLSGRIEQLSDSVIVTPPKDKP